MNEVKTPETMELELYRICNDDQAREDFGQNDGSLIRLGESIKTAGLVQPIVVNQDPQTKQYVLVSGERRLLALREAGIERSDVRVFTGLSRLDILQLQIAENMHRKDLNPIEEAQVFEDLADAGGFETHTQVAEYVHCSEDKVSRRRALLRLSRTVRDLIACGRLTLHHANELTKKGLCGDEQIRLANRTVREGLSPEQLRDEVNAVINPPLPNVQKSSVSSPAGGFRDSGDDHDETEQQSAGGGSQKLQGWRGLEISEEFDLPPRILKALAGHTPPLETVGQLVDWMNGKGDWWAKDIKGVGPEAAEQIAAAMDSFWEDHPEAVDDMVGGEPDESEDEDKKPSKHCVTTKLVITVPLFLGNDSEEDFYDLESAKITAVADSESREFATNRKEIELTSIWRHFTEVIGEMLQEK